MFLFEPLKDGNKVLVPYSLFCPFKAEILQTNHMKFTTDSGLLWKKSSSFYADSTLNHNFWTIALIFLAFIPSYFSQGKEPIVCILPKYIPKALEVFASCFCISFGVTITQQAVDWNAQTNIIPLKNT